MSVRRLEPALHVFREVIERPAAERGAFLAEACGDDAELRAQVESMLAWDEEAGDDDGEDGGSVSSPVRAALDGLVDQAHAEPLPASIGGYRIVGLVAHGGMGVVYEAAQEHPDRRVAIKVARAGTSDEGGRRFALEAQLLARLDHPGIARIIEAGTTPKDQGQQLFLVMELVAGETITKHAKTRALSTRERLELLVRVAEPIAFAHGHGVIHRDLKPDNVLIAADGSPKVLDFGVAKVAAASSFGAATMRTEVGRVIGTIGYMAPEQLGGESEGLTAAADVYALGVMAYELLSGRLPHQLDGITLSRALAIVTSTDPPRLGVVQPALRGDVEAIVAKALEKEPRDRYPDARAFQADLERCLREEPVLARRHSKLLRFRKFSRRNRALVTGLATTFAALLLGLIVALVFAAGEARQRTRYDQLAAVVGHDRLLEAAPELDPPWPDKVPRIRGWLADCDALLARRTDLRRTTQALASAPGDAPRFLRDTLGRLLADLDRLETDLRPAVERRLRWAEAVHGATLAHPKARVSWDAARTAIAASDRYAGQSIDLRPEDVLGLVPIGANPVSGLWEFYHLRSAWDGESDPRSIEIPQHRPDGTIDVQESSGMVLVLVPGGTFWMGEQKEDESLPNYYAKARAFESRHGLAHEVTLGPYLLSRYEMTQGQWARLTGGARPSGWRTGLPATHGPTPIGDDRHPVELVTWSACDALLHRFALTIPTEAQWERACRAGTTTPWSTGPDGASLEGHANLQDETAKREWHVVKNCVPFDDGWLGSAPVGSYRPNGFGLCDMHGNVAEWVREALPCPYSTEPRAGDGFRPSPPDVPHAASFGRGGSFMDLAPGARSAFRRDMAKGTSVIALGIRPARELRPR